MSALTEFKQRLFNLQKSSKNLQQWCNSVNEIIGIYDFEDDEIYQTILATIPNQFIPAKEAKNIQAETYIEFLQALQDYEFSKNCGKLFFELSNDDGKMKMNKFEELFDKLEAESHSAQDLKPFLAVLALEDDSSMRKSLLQYLSTHPGSTYQEAKNNIGKN
uniref:Uncharacterized protein n=1 Tax=Panagrolaimus sp. ES5 TaxID=591445 RepID=A0AC34FD47_9BILA